MATSIFLVAIGDVRAFEISNIHNPIKGYDTFNISKLQFFFRRINTALGGVYGEKKIEVSKFGRCHNLLLGYECSIFQKP
jgi:hypothetical protein